MEIITLICMCIAIAVILINEIIQCYKIDTSKPVEIVKSVVVPKGYAATLKSKKNIVKRSIDDGFGYGIKTINESRTASVGTAWTNKSGPNAFGSKASLYEGMMMPKEFREIMLEISKSK